MAGTVTDYERSLIGSIMNRPAEAMPEAMTAGVSASWFSDDGWSLAWSALEGYWTRGEIESVTWLAVRAEARRLSKREREHRSAEGLTVAEMEKAVESASLGKLDATIRLLRNCAIERAAKGAVADCMSKIETYADYTDGVLDLRGRLDQILGGAIESKKISPRRVFDDILAEYETAYAQRVDPNGPRDLHWTPGHKMPWAKLTENMNGLRPGLHIIAARPSVGKTSFAVNLMHYWCETGVPVLFNSLDMAEREALRRYIAEKSRVSINKASFTPTKRDLESMRAAVAAMSEWPLQVTEIHDVEELRTFCMVEKSAGRLGIVVIDYLQLLHAKSLGREDAVEYARISRVSDTLKRLANELRIPVIALAQLNRESTKQDAQGRLPGLADLRGSGSIEQDAFTVTILHRDQQVVEKWRSGIGCDRAKRLIPGSGENPNYNYNFDDLDPVWWIMCKSQNGATCKFPFVVRKKYFTWMLADYGADALKVETGYGSTKRTTVDNSPKFERVYGDWRHDPIEEVLRQQLALIPDRSDGAVANAADDDYPKI